jgi:NAD(P)H-quinone oxidoreductase subunit 5
MKYEDIYWYLGLIVLSAPALMVAILGTPTLLGRPLKERFIGHTVQACVVTGLLAALAVLGMMLIHGERHVHVDLGTWVQAGHEHHGQDTADVSEFAFSIRFIFDRLSVPFVILTFVLCGTIGAFANRYMHREQGFNRFFVLYAFFVLGMIVTSLAGTIETLFAGWELVGLSSAMLVAFFHERQSPVKNGLHIWTIYRVSDAALLIASVVLHHMRGHGDFDGFLEVVTKGAEITGWPDGVTPLTSNQALWVGLLLLLAAAGKSALVPFSGWLPRAMEGPTPSSAVFYGALSVHLGAFLLLRMAPLLDASPTLRVCVIALGLITALYATFAERVQTDIKSALSFASLVQVGVIVAEIGLGLRYIALAHIIGHACLRTLQFLRAPTLLHDYRILENAIGVSVARPQPQRGMLSPGLRGWLYLFSLERGFLDVWLLEYIARPFVSVFRVCDSWERRWTDFLEGGRSRESDQLTPLAGSLDDLT